MQGIGLKRQRNGEEGWKKAKRLGIFIDVPNLYYTTRERYGQDARVNFEALFNFIKKHTCSSKSTPVVGDTQPCVPHKTCTGVK